MTLVCGKKCSILIMQARCLSMISLFWLSFLRFQILGNDLTLITQGLSEALDSRGPDWCGVHGFFYGIISLNILIAISLIQFFRTYAVDRSYYVAYNGFRSQPFLAIQEFRKDQLLFLLITDGLMNSIDYNSTEDCLEWIQAIFN